VECLFSDPLNKAWKASVKQGREEPLVQRLNEIAVLEASCLKCPKEVGASGTVGFRTLRSQSQHVTPFKICDYRFAAGVQGTWMEDEITRVRSPPSGSICGFGVAEGSATIALCLAKLSFNVKTLDDFGIIEAGSKKYTLPAVHYTSAAHFQVCEGGYRLVFLPHAIVRSHFQEIPGT